MAYLLTPPTVSYNRLLCGAQSEMSVQEGAFWHQLQCPDTGHRLSQCLVVTLQVRGFVCVEEG